MALSGLVVAVQCRERNSLPNVHSWARHAERVAHPGLGLLVARGWQQPTLQSRLLAAVALLLAALFTQKVMFGFFGVLLPLAMLLVISRPWYFALLPGLVCLAANQWQVLYYAARLGNSAAIPGIATCLIAPWLGLFLLRHFHDVKAPPMRRWAYALYPLHFLLLLAVRQVFT